MAQIFVKQGKFYGFLYQNHLSACEGEGVRLGSAQIFIRFQGCAVGCQNCETKETWDFKGVPKMGLENLLETIEQISIKSRKPVKSISITGGDPLHPSHRIGLIELIKELKKRNYFINLEASGQQIVPEVFDSIDFISFDYKTPSTGVKGKVELIAKLMKKYPGKFQVKSVVSSDHDFRETLKARNELLNLVGILSLDFSWVLTPAYTPGQKFLLSDFASLLQKNIDEGGPFRVIGQQHKWIFGPNRQDV